MCDRIDKGGGPLARPHLRKAPCARQRQLRLRLRGWVVGGHRDHLVAAVREMVGHTLGVDLVGPAPHLCECFGEGFVAIHDAFAFGFHVLAPIGLFDPMRSVRWNGFTSSRSVVG